MGYKGGRHRKDPFRQVTEAILEDDDKLGRWWCLVLECGHDDIRPVTYVYKAGVRRGGDREQGTTIRALEDVVPAPKKVRCDECRCSSRDDVSGGAASVEWPPTTQGRCFGAFWNRNVDAEQLGFVARLRASRLFAKRVPALGCGWDVQPHPRLFVVRSECQTSCRAHESDGVCDSTQKRVPERR